MSPVTTDKPTTERALYLPSGTEKIFAIATAPALPPAGLGVVLAHSGANNFSAHRNAVWTRLARQLAREGIGSLRFDFAGTGESSGQLVQQLTGQPVTDATVAMDAMRAAGCRRLLLVGSCFGAIPSVMAGVARDDVAGVIMLSPPLVLPGTGGTATVRERVREVVSLPALRTVATNRDYRRWYFARLASLAGTRATMQLRRLTAGPPRSGQPERSASPERSARPQRSASPERSGLILERELARLVTGGSRVEVVYGTHDGNLARVSADPDATRAVRLLRDRPAGLKWTVLEGPVHGLEDVGVQEQLIRLIAGRARDLAA
jgi:pimeloyl-ACP methyl ester carboxylesterase